jgi:hypothetical protein
MGEEQFPNGPLFPEAGIDLPVCFGGDDFCMLFHLVREVEGQAGGSELPY